MSCSVSASSRPILPAWPLERGREALRGVAPRPAPGIYECSSCLNTFFLQLVVHKGLQANLHARARKHQHATYTCMRHSAYTRAHADTRARSHSLLCAWLAHTHAELIPGAEEEEELDQRAPWAPVLELLPGLLLLPGRLLLLLLLLLPGRLP